MSAIRSHLLMRGFIKDCTIRIHHSKTVVNAELKEEHMDYMDTCIAELYVERVATKKVGVGMENASAIKMTAVVEMIVDVSGTGDYLEEMLRNIGQGVLLRSAKGR